MREHFRMILLAGLIAMMAVAFAACGSSDTAETNTTQPQEKSVDQGNASEEPAAEEPAAEEADGFDITEGFKLETSGSELLLHGNGFVLTMPNEDTWDYEQGSPTTLTIYDKKAREAGYGGELVTIMAFDPDDTTYEELPGYAVAGTGKNVNKTFIAQFPTDAQFDPSDADGQAEYTELLDYVKKISEGAADSPFRTTDSE